VPAFLSMDITVPLSTYRLGCVLALRLQPAEKTSRALRQSSENEFSFRDIGNLYYLPSCSFAIRIMAEAKAPVSRNELGGAAEAAPFQNDIQ
jgi:hypothetical protein